MQTIFVMVKCELGRAYAVADEAIDLDNVSEVYSISGQHDLMIKCYLEDDQDIGQFVVDTIQPLKGIKDTFTLVAYKAFN